MLFGSDRNGAKVCRKKPSMWDTLVASQLHRCWGVAVRITMSTWHVKSLSQIDSIEITWVERFNLGASWKNMFTDVPQEKQSLNSIKWCGYFHCFRNNGLTWGALSVWCFDRVLLSTQICSLQKPCWFLLIDGCAVCAVFFIQYHAGITMISWTQNLCLKRPNDISGFEPCSPDIWDNPTTTACKTHLNKPFDFDCHGMLWWYCLTYHDIPNNHGICDHNIIYNGRLK